MNYEYIEQLLNKYWECDTSIEEEQILRSFFSQESIPEKFRQYAPLFRVQTDEHEQVLGTDFDKRMADIIGTDIDAGREPVVARVFRMVTRQVYPFVKAAAVVAVILTIGNVTERVAMDQESIDTISGIDGTYVRQENIAAQIKIIDQTRSSSSIAKVDSLSESGSLTPSKPDKANQTETIR